jgi:hypothetical protein
MTTKQATVQGSRGRSAGIVAAATLVALVIWRLARVLGVELTVGKGGQASLVGATDVLVAVLVAGVAGAAAPCSPWGRWMVAICWQHHAGHLHHRADLACRRCRQRRAHQHAPGRRPRAHRRPQPARQDP